MVMAAQASGTPCQRDMDMVNSNNYNTITGIHLQARTRSFGSGSHLSTRMAMGQSQRREYLGFRAALRVY